MITGSTDGIGKAYALDLASRGFNIVLVSRTQSRLDGVKKEILGKSPDVEVRTIKFDFTNANLEDYKEVIVKELNGLDVGMLGKEILLAFFISPHSLTTSTHLFYPHPLPPTLVTPYLVVRMVPMVGPPKESKKIIRVSLMFYVFFF